MGFRPETLTVVIALALVGCGGHARGNAPSDEPGATKPDETEPDETEPDETEPEDGRLMKVSLSDQSACALSRDGRVACFEFPDGFETATAPVAGKFRDVAGSAGRGAALREDGSVVTWGDEPPRFPQGSLEQIALDPYSACGIRTDGSIACNGDAAPVDSLAGNFQQLQVAGNGGLCAVTTDGELRCKTTPAWHVEPPTDLPPLREVSVDPTGEMGGCALDIEGQLHCWGYYCPIPGTFSHVSLSYMRACATTINGELQCWNYHLALDDCTSPPSELNLPPPPSGTFTTLASWLLKSCAIEASGDSVQCW